MSDDEISLSIEWAKRYAIFQKCRNVVWLWHGGEPMLLGADKFQALTEIIRSVFTKESISISFRLQTNLTLLNQKWIDIFKSDYCRTIGASLDYCTEARVDATGKSYDQTVLQNILMLRKNKIDVSVISLVTPQNIGRIHEMYNFYKSKGLSFKTARYFPSTTPREEELAYAITDEEYAKFLCALYDIWIEDDRPGIKILNLLEAATGLITGRRKLCTAEPGKCYKNYLCIEAGGEIYNCGRYDAPQQRLGTIHDSPEAIATLVKKRAETPLPAECTNCHCLPLCHGGCPFERETSGRFLNCFVTKVVLTHIATHLKASGVKISVDPTL